MTLHSLKDFRFYTIQTSAIFLFSFDFERVCGRLHGLMQACTSDSTLLLCLFCRQDSHFVFYMRGSRKVLLHQLRNSSIQLGGDDGPTLSFVIFQGVQISIHKETYSLIISQGGPDPLDPRMCTYVFSIIQHV